MKFVCMGYLDESKFEQLSKEQAEQLMERCMDYDDQLRRGGHFVGGEALQTAKSAVTLQMKNGAVEATDGPFAETKEILGGLLFLEAEDMSQAVQLMSKHPGVAMGPFEIRPVDQQINEMLAARATAFESQK